jgi:hypothetical protein
VDIVDRPRPVNLRRALRIDVNSTMIMLTAPNVMSAIPSTWKGTPLKQDVPRPACALSVQAESNVVEALITQRPTATVTKHKINVSALFTNPVYHREGV